jgi:2-polyprenyl-6-methoxyphenol hydroxylase-like FAD-dependent oxidoreductase
MQVAIVGGGIGGLALGVALKHRGIPYTIYERDESFAQRRQGYGLTMQQASKAVKSFGIRTLSEGITSTKHVVHTPDGNEVGSWGL